MDPVALQDIVDVVNGTWLSLGPDSSTPGRACVDRILTDSRALTHGQEWSESSDQALFVAIDGPRFDGHDYLKEVSPRVSATIVAESRIEKVRACAANAGSGMGAIVVDDPVDALADLARWYRKRLSARVIGVTGSVGKTTVKDFLGQLLSCHYPTVSATKSFNNRLGVSLTILNASSSTRYLIVEMGTSGPGEIADLSRVVAPDFAVVTAVGHAHLQGLGDLQGVAREKSSIFEGLQPGGSAVIPAPIFDEQRFLDRAWRHAGQVHRVGWSLDDSRPGGYWITACDPVARGPHRLPGFQFEINHRYRFELPLPGSHNVFNALVAMTVAHECGMDWSDLRDPLSRLTLPPLRLQMSTAGGVTIVDDTYNANPLSVRGALQAVRDIPLESGGRWFLVLGDLLELGDNATLFHHHLGTEIADSGTFAGMCAVGDQARHAAESARERGLESLMVESDASDSDRVVEELLAVLRPGDGVLFKASRGVALDGVVRKLRDLLGGENRITKKIAEEKDLDERGREANHALLSL